MRNMLIRIKGAQSVDEIALEGGCAYYISGEGDELLCHVDIPDTVDFVAIENNCDFWCRPFWGSSLTELHERTQALLIRDGELYKYLVPLCGEVYKSVLRGGEGGLELYTYSNSSRVTACRHQLALLYLEGEEPLSLVRRAAEQICSLIPGLKLREQREYPEVLEYLGWCSWDAFQIRVDHEGLLAKAREFKSKGVPVRFAIIDDMWADVPSLGEIPEDASYADMVGAMHRSRLRSFEGDPRRFPRGMGAAIDGLKKAGIDHVGVWFPTTGYWAGLDPDGEEAKAQSENTVTLANGQVIVAPDAERAYRYFDSLCSRVRSWGADFVKIDNQGFHKRYKDMEAIGVSARAIQSAIDDATEKHFGGALINCMGMPSECMLNRRSAVSRCSNDFMPEDKAWFARNVLRSSFNGLLQGQLYYNDFDMWWTDDEQAVKNSVCRAISGGPIYVSDKLGRTNPEVLRPLCTEDGRIIRPDESATPTADCLMRDPTTTDKIFKLRNRFGENGVCAVLNLSRDGLPVSGTLYPAELGIDEVDYFYYEHFTRTEGVLLAGEGLDITLRDNDEIRLYSLVPVARCRGGRYPGRKDLYMGVGVPREEQRA